MRDLHDTTAEVFAFPLAIALIPVVVAVACLVLGVVCFRKREARRLSYFLLAIVLWLQAWALAGQANGAKKAGAGS